jgi:hypothetical protein
MAVRASAMAVDTRGRGGSAQIGVVLEPNVDHNALYGKTWAGTPTVVSEPRAHHTFKLVSTLAIDLVFVTRLRKFRARLS